ncbi:TonB family protein [Labrys sp. KB_33_2]|uniref:TonB family protein n=1 Tax=unclassified Labrys (in: a-proteobacteria) TaxID=2688601 RepID=UPI003EBFE6C1
MTDWAITDHGNRAADLALWVGAGLLTLGIHLGAAVWYLQPSPAAPAADAPPPAIMIEFAPMPEARETQANEISPDLRPAEPQAASEAVTTPEEAVPPEPVKEVPAPEPVTEAAKPEPTMETTQTPVEQAEVALPQERPVQKQAKQETARREEPKKPLKQKPAKPRRQQAQEASKAAVEAQVQASQSSRNAARQTSSSQVSGPAPAQWRSQLIAHLERRKRYPADARSRGERGIAYVRFRIDDAGNVLAASLYRSSGFAELDQEVVSLVRRASPVPPPPAGMNRTITAPVLFDSR